MLKVAIRIRGELDPHWSSWFEDLSVTHMDEGETVLSGGVPDQSALYGLLGRLRHLGLVLLSVESEDAEETTE